MMTCCLIPSTYEPINVNNEHVCKRVDKDGKMEIDDQLVIPLTLKKLNT